MKQQIKLNKVNFSRATKKLTKLIKEVSNNFKNNEVADMLAKSFGFNSYHHAQKENFLTKGSFSENGNNDNEFNKTLVVLKFSNFKERKIERNELVYVFNTKPENKLNSYDIFSCHDVSCYFKDLVLKVEENIKIFNDWLDKYVKIGFISLEDKGKNIFYFLDSYVFNYGKMSEEDEEKAKLELTNIINNELDEGLLVISENKEGKFVFFNEIEVLNLSKNEYLLLERFGNVVKNIYI